MTDLRLVMKVAVWSQDHDWELEYQFAQIYRGAKDTGYGWESVQESSPELFIKAVELARKHIDRVS